MIDISTKSEVGWANSLALFSRARGSPKQVSYIHCGACRIGILSDTFRNIENTLHYVTPVNSTVNSGGQSLPVLRRADECTIGLGKETPHR
ncbi:hypothetical protein I7I53_00949 [Histoplasma capsulatum var. duboisii H88]|uniref:Uncharacterized protein n=1 Tax=Ajellomyces capsulatus (strain H88) TaxID=544711 RepID=A0A8A1LI89_AJEC8|nr:hypothetical protein I7I53_00949 [Histoplasma capsulatum var. duboisii H88]